MGRSLATPKDPLPAFRKEILAVEQKDGKSYHSVLRDGLTAEYPIAITIGSGKVGHSYGVRIGDSVFQSPISWFSQAQHWDLSPGYDRRSLLDFDRRITMECLYCHSGGMRKVTDTPHSITCERCHTASDKHFENPAKLPASSRDIICEQCHLQGEARVLNPGSSWSGANPSFTTYVSAKSSGAQKVVSQVEQLALSKCAQRSEGKLWCGSCHNPHGAAKDQRTVCLSCHADQLPGSHVKEHQDCVTCHMPRLPSTQVAHTVYTDHRIRRSAESPAVAVASTKIVAWRQPAPEYRDRNLGLANVYAGQLSQSADLIQQGFKVLVSVQKKDGEVLSALGSVLMQKQRPAEAAELFAQAARLQPENAGYARNLGVALLSRGDKNAAIAEFERAIRLDPVDELAYSLLVQIYTDSGNAGLRRETIARYLQVNPQSLKFRLMQY